jgi:hypothetical protein
VEDRVVLSTFVVTNTNDSGPGSLRQAILNSNATNPSTTGGTSDIVFDIPASTASNLGSPFPGFDPATQTWTITLASPLPPITNPVSIDGFSQAQFAVPYRYPSQLSSTVQSVSVSPPGSLVTGGYFTLATTDPQLTPGGTTVPIPFDATADVLQKALEQVVGQGNVSVLGDPASGLSFITFQGIYAGKSINTLAISSHVTGIGTPPPQFTAQTVTTGGVPVLPPILISSSPNTTPARAGNNAEARLIIDGSGTGGATGFVLDASHSTLRGLIIDGFGVGVSVPHLDPSGNPIVGDLIQGNFIGDYFVYPVDPTTGQALPTPNNVAVAGRGNSLQGVLLDANNTTVGGINPQENNVIAGNGQEGVLIQVDATGNVVEGNQIGILGPSISGLYFQRGNRAEGVLDFGASNQIGGVKSVQIGFSPDAGNLISGNGSHGVRITSSVATRNVVAGNLIGLAPGGGYRFGTGDPGNGDAGDGVRIEDAAQNQIGGPTADWGNTISSNFGSGVYITGAAAAGTTILDNLIGVTYDGQAAKGNARDGVTDFSPGTIIGPGNQISGNLRGVLISGPSATGVVVRDNLIGTNGNGVYDLGNSREGVLIDNAGGNMITGDGNGSQVISGNLIGVAITSSSSPLSPSSLNLVAGNLIGSDKSGLNPLPNSQEGVLIDSSSGNSIGGTTAAARNLISANHWGLVIRGSTVTGATASNNVIQGNDIGTDITGQAPLANEVKGVIVGVNASGNLIGGSSTAAGNIIAFSPDVGVLVDSGFFNSILTNSIFSNAVKGIELVNNGNHMQPAPTLSSVQSLTAGTLIKGTVQGTPSTPYTVQFFSNPVRGPEGKTFIGQVTVTTDGTGFAPFTANLPTAITSAQPFITATATSAPGDTSEFSSTGSVVPFTVEFSMASYTVSQSAGTATITVVRSGGGAATVAYATSDGTAMAGRDYVAASGVLSFQEGQTQQTFTVSIINTQQVGESRYLNLSLSNPTGGLALGSPSTATLTILGFTGTGPTVQSLQPISTVHGITAVVLTFSQPLDPSRAVNLLNYGYSLQAVGNDQRFGTADDLLFGIASATYNAASDSVTLRLASPIRCNSFIRLTINQSTDNATVPVGVADTSGNLLDGDYNGHPGGVFTAYFARSPHLRYLDGHGNSVFLTLAGGGTMVLVRHASGEAWQLTLLHTVPGRSTLSGTVRKAAAGATGVTTIPSIVGTAGVRVLLTNPPFVVGAEPAMSTAGSPALGGKTSIPPGRAASLPRAFPARRFPAFARRQKPV